MKIPDELRKFLNELADQLRIDNLLFKLTVKYVEEQNKDLADVVKINIELTEDKWARVLEELEHSF